VDLNWYLPRLKRARDFGINMGKVCVETWSQDFVEPQMKAGIISSRKCPLAWGRCSGPNRYTIDKEFRNYFSQELDGLVKQSRNHARWSATACPANWSLAPDPGII